MKCSKCGFENKEGAKFCTKCGTSLTNNNGASNSSNNSKIAIIGLVIVIIALVLIIGYFTVNSNILQSDANSQSVSGDVESVDNSSESVGEDSDKTNEISSSKKATKSKSWESIGKYSGSGSGSEVITVPEGKIKVTLSAYPIKNYATNYLYVTGSNGASGGVEWGSKSAVETRSDSFEYSSAYEETFTIDYYETVSWEVEFFRYQ